jgi:predicted GIY-YIG superfamily endonuclease
VSLPEKCTVYIIRSQKNPARHYIGLTSDLARRLEWHNAGLNVATAAHGPWTVLVSVQFTTEAAAVRFERYLKSGSGRAFAKRHLG